MRLHQECRCHIVCQSLSIEHAPKCACRLSPLESDGIGKFRHFFPIIIRPNKRVTRSRRYRDFSHTHHMLLRIVGTFLRGTTPHVRRDIEPSRNQENHRAIKQVIDPSRKSPKNQENHQETKKCIEMPRKSRKMPSRIETLYIQYNRQVNTPQSIHNCGTHRISNSQPTMEPFRSSGL